MSAAHQFRQHLRSSITDARLGLNFDDIIIERQGDIFNDIQNAVSAAENGICLHLPVPRKVNIAQPAEKPAWRVSQTIRLWVNPIYQDSYQPEEEITEQLENHLSGLVLDTSVPLAIQRTMQIKVLESYEVPDPDYLVREITIEAIIHNQ